MEYYILKIYQSEKEKNTDVEQGFNRYQPNTKRIIISCFTIMFFAYIEVIVTLFIFPQKAWFYIGILICIIALLILLKTDSKDKKAHMDKYVDTYKKKINILYELLLNEFQIDSREKVEELICLYQLYVDERNKEEKSCNKAVFSLFSSFAAIVSI